MVFYWLTEVIGGYGFVREVFYCPGIPSELKSRVRSASSSSVSECPAKIGTSFNNVFRVSPALEGRDKFGSFLLSFLFASTLLKLIFNKIFLRFRKIG